MKAEGRDPIGRHPELLGTVIEEECMACVFNNAVGAMRLRRQLATLPAREDFHPDEYQGAGEEVVVLRARVRVERGLLQGLRSGQGRARSVHEGLEAMKKEAAGVSPVFSGTVLRQEVSERERD